MFLLRLAAALLLASMVAPASAAGGEGEGADVMAREVTAVVEDMASRWGSGRRHTIVRDLWDVTDPQVMYLAGEQPDWFIGAPAIEAYLAIRPNAPPTVSSYEVDALRVRPMGRDQAIVTWNLDYQFQRGTLPAMRERLRASALLRRTPDGWKFSHYSESPKSSMTYLRDLYEATVTPEFRRKVEAAAATSEKIATAPR